MYGDWSDRSDFPPATAGGNGALNEPNGFATTSKLVASKATSAMMVYMVVLFAFISVSGINAASAVCSAVESQLPCAGGCYFNTEILKCEDASAGRFSPSDDNYQYRCQPGSFSVGAAASCTPCPIGQFANEYVSKVCHPCGIAQYSATPGAKRCKSCNPARYIGYGAKEVVLEYGIAFCVEPELTIPPTNSPTLSPMPTCSPTMFPAIRRTSSPERPRTTLKPSAPLYDWTLTDPLASSYPTAVEQRVSSPTSSLATPFPHEASPPKKPSDNRPSHLPFQDSTSSESPVIEKYDSSSTATSPPPSLTNPTTAAPTTRLNTKESARFWTVFLPNFLVTCIITSFACCCFIAGPQQHAEELPDKPNDDDEIAMDEEVTMGETTTMGDSQ